MLKTLLPCCALALFSILASAFDLKLASGNRRASRASALELAQRPMASFMPANSILYAEAPGLSPFLEAGLDHPLVQNILHSELGAQLSSQDDVPLEQKLKFISAVFGEPLLPALDALSRHGLALSVSVRGQEPSFLLAAQSSSAADAERILDRALRFMESNGFDSKPKRLDGALLWNLKNGAVLVRQGNIVLLASSQESAQEALELADLDEPAGLHSRPEFKLVMQRSGATSTLRAWVDQDALGTVDSKKYGWMERLQHTPEGQLLLGPGISSLSGSDALGLSLELSGGDLELEIWGSGQEWLAPLGPQHAADDHAPPSALVLEESLGQALLYRDIETFLAERPALLEARDLPGVSSALNTISLFFGGRDFGEEVSPDLSPWAQIIATELDYVAGPTPAVQFPAAALIVELHDAERSGQRWMTAFQSIIGIINIEAAQKNEGRGSMLLGLGLEGETQLSYASYPLPAEGEPVDARYNLRPACCVLEDRLILASHEDLLRQIVRQLKQTPRARAEEEPLQREVLRLRAAPLEHLIQANFETLVMNKVVDEGVSFEEATEELKGLALALGLIEDLNIKIDYGDPDTVVAKIHIALRSAEDDDQ